MSTKQAELKKWHDWTDPDFFTTGQQSEKRLLPLFLRQMLPTRVQRTKLTLTGWMLIIVAMGIGSAAYNTASNILFLTLSLILSSLVLSGILSLINFKKLDWRLEVPRHLQVGEVGAAEVSLENRKRIFPSMSLRFRVGHSDQDGTDLLYLPGALPVRAKTRIEWTFTPRRRGRCELSLHGVESKFPFGFISKTFGLSQQESVLVWPARADYFFQPPAQGRRYFSGSSKLNAGLGNDLLKIRDYVPGDAPRLIHWKATARTNKLMVRQLAHEGEGGFHLVLNPDASMWNGEFFEKLCSLACSLAEDLFHAGRLNSARVLGQDRITVRSMRELHGFFDQLAELEPTSNVPASSERAGQNCITFRALGEGGIAIYVDDTRAGEIDA